GYRLALKPEAIDAIAFEGLAADGRRILASGEPSRAAAVLLQALGLWRGEPYGELAWAEFAIGEVARLGELRCGALEDLAEARLEGGSLEVVTAELERLVAEQPGRERARELFVRALYAGGRQRDALRAYQR